VTPSEDCNQAMASEDMEDITCAAVTVICSVQICEMVMVTSVQ
jgi:hypothetical protein